MLEEEEPKARSLSGVQAYRQRPTARQHNTAHVVAMGKEAGSLKVGSKTN